jgi:putative addiction module antidote
MPTAKVTSIGDSITIVLPPESVARFRLTVGDELELSENGAGIQLHPLKSEAEAHLVVAKKVMAEDRDVLQKLAE